LIQAGSGEPSGGSIGKLDEREHHGNLDEDADDGSQHHRGGGTEERNRHRHRQFKEVRGADHAARCRDIVRQAELFPGQIGDKEDEVGLDDQRHGDQHDVQRIVQDHVALKREDQHQSQKQTTDGDIVELGGKLVKNVTGYDLVKLMVGSEGTLGIFTKIILKLIPKPTLQADLLCLFKTSDAAISMVPKIITEGGIIPTSVEFMDKLSVQAGCEYLNESLPYQDCGAMLLISVDGTDMEEIEQQYITIGKFCKEGGATEVYVADNTSTSERIWSVRRNIAEAFNLISKRQCNEDIVVPPAQIPDAIRFLEDIAEKYGIIIPCFGHAGDGNIHARVTCPEDWSDEKWHDSVPKILGEIYAMLKQYGGMLSGEHGIGHKRKKYMDQVVSPEYMALLKGIKRTFDPNNIMNPGKIFDMP